MVLHDFAQEYRVGFKLAFLRPFAVPRMADVLAGTGQMIDNADRRGQRTAVLMYEIIADGLEGPRARRVVEHINRAHSSPAVRQDDLTYVLCAFIVVPTRYIHRYGSRKLTPGEQEVSVQYYRELGRLLQIDDLPETYRDAERIFDDYEDAHVAPSESGRGIGQAVIVLLRRRTPRPIRGLTPVLFATQAQDARVMKALGIPAGSRAARCAIDVAYRMAGRLRARTAWPQAPVFTPERGTSRHTFPQGYSLDDLLRYPG